MDQETKTSASALFSDGTHGGATESLLSSFAMSLTFENVCCDVDLGGGHTRRVLHEVSGRVEAGQMVRRAWRVGCEMRTGGVTHM